ncbi:hypothetical protein LL14B4_10195 [Lactococcus lactis subsp. lactis]|uniref:Uncharacterized protein n=1 Tax=Lactococcus lactis subsp. lactis TaxID=1360 RepID=A0A2Z3KQB2_LACLL|nr:hypothetical protein [Lactococcus lactis]AWN66523.1 hypothetical protein LL14B4_10195 [Lactococcus lactis subsp. lactis]
MTYLEEPIKIYSTQKKDMKLFMNISIYTIGAGAVQIPLGLFLYNQKVHLIFLIPILIMTSILTFNGVRYSSKLKGRRHYKNILRALYQNKKKMQIYNIEAFNWAQEEIQEDEPFTETVEEMEAYLLERMAECGVLSKKQLQEIEKEKR